MKVCLVLMLSAASLAAQTESQPARPANASKPEAKSCPLHAQHTRARSAREDQRFSEMNERGARSMGFDQTKTSHHFRIFDDGGAIEVAVKQPRDAANLTAIRQHLRQIAQDFANGNFTASLATHSEMPPGVDVMQRLKDKIAFDYEELPNGARVRISTSDPDARRAVREFLEYQIREHRTGDPIQAPQE